MRKRNRPLFERKLFLCIIYFLFTCTSSVYCDVFRKYEFENHVGIMGWFERIIGEKFGNKRIE